MMGDNLNNVSGFDAFHREMMDQTPADFYGTADMLRNFYSACKDKGFTPNQSLELTKTFLQELIENSIRGK